MNDEDDLLTAEFALGLLDGPERKTMQNRITSDAQLAARADWWRDRFEPLSSDLRDEPSPELWDRIEEHLPKNDNAARGWRAIALTATLVAAFLGVGIVMRPAPTPVAAVPATTDSVPEPILVASLTDKNEVVATIAYERAIGRLTIVPVKLDPGAGSAQLWIIPADGKPRSLGLIDPADAANVQAPADVRSLIARYATVAISLEPLGGSTTGSPTGPVVASGKLGGA